MPFASGTRRSPIDELRALSQRPEQAKPVRRQKAPKPRPNPFAVPEPEPVVEAPAEAWGPRDYAAMGVRGLGGMLGIGAAPGAAFGAGSEAIANVIEGDSLLDPETLKEIGAAGVLGASGGGIAKMVGAGAGALQALLRGGALAGGAEAASEYIRGEELDPASIAFSGAVGGGSASAMSALLKRFGVTTPPGAKPPAGPAKPTFEVEQTPGPGMKPGDGKALPSTLGAGPITRSIKGEGDPLSHTIPPGLDLGEDLRPGAYPDAGGLSPRATKAVAAAEKADEARIAQARVDAALDAALDEGLIPQATVTESFQTPIPGGKRSMRRKYVDPDAEVEGGVIKSKSPKTKHGKLAAQLGVTAKAPAAITEASEAAPRALDELLGVAERRSGERTPELDELYRAERQGVDPLGVAQPVAALKVERRAPKIAPIREPSEGEEAGIAKLTGLFARHGDDYSPPGTGGTGGALTPEELAAAAGIPHGRPVIGDELDELIAAAPVPVTPQPPAQQQPSMQELTKLFGLMTTTPDTTPGLAAGANYRLMKGLFERGETGLSPEAVDEFGRSVLGKGVGRRAHKLAEAEGIPPGPPQAGPPPAPKAALPPPAPAFGAKASDDLKAFFMGQGRRPGPQGGLGPSRFGGETGQVDPALLASVGLGLTGAAAGGAIDDEDPLRGALIGGAAGVALPQLASKIAAVAPRLFADPSVPDDVKGLLQNLGTKEGAATAVMDVVRTLPAIMRGNLLASQNIFNNAMVGPYSAAATFGLERYLAGDPRGLAVLQQLSPQAFGKSMWNSWAEARTLIGEAERAGGPLVGQAGTAIEKVAAIPGTFMAGGDLAARKAIMAAGFTEAEARMATLTAEPETKAGKALVNMQRSGGPLLQTAAPFVRTIVNLGEQAVRRTPGIGYLAQAAREVPDEMRVQHIQQLLGGGALLGGYAGGQGIDELAREIDIPGLPDDPASNTRLLRSFLSNAAGPASTLATIGMAAGRAADAGKAPLQQIGAAGRAAIQEAPLPTAAPATELWNFLTAEPGTRRLPQGAVPGIVREEANEFLFGPARNQAGGRRKSRRTQSRAEER